MVLNDTLHHRIGGVLVKARLRYPLGFRSRGNTGDELLLDLAGKLQTERVGFPQRESGSASSNATAVTADVSLRRRSP